MEEVFVLVSPVLNLHVGGRIIRTTAEHPFYVQGRGWVAAAFLEIGDSLQSHDGKPITVEGVADSGEVLTVYNFRIADYHTYFVGGDEWGFDVWAHNAYEPRRSDLKGGPHASNRKIGQAIDRAFGTREPQGRWNSPMAARNAASQFDPALANQYNAHSVQIQPGDGIVLYPLSNRGGVMISQADRALVRMMGDGKIHTFPIGPEHPLY